jgi:hypothetical protein
MSSVQQQISAFHDVHGQNYPTLLKGRCHHMPIAKAAGVRRDPD